MEPSPQGYRPHRSTHVCCVDCPQWITHRLAGGDLEDLGGEADGALDTELLVLRPVDQVSRDCTDRSVILILNHSPLGVPTLLKVLDVAARERDADFVDLGGGHGGTSRVVLLFTLSDVTHPGICW